MQPLQGEEASAVETEIVSDTPGSYESLQNCHSDRVNQVLKKLDEEEKIKAKAGGLLAHYITCFCF